MPKRRGWAGFAGGLAEGVGGVAQQFLARSFKEEDTQDALARQLIKDYSDRVTKGEIDPDQAEHAIRMQLGPNARLPQGYFQSLAPSVTQRLSGTLGKIDAADSVSKVPTLGAVGTDLKAKRVPLMDFGRIDPHTGVNDSRISSQLASVLDERNTKLDSFPAVKTPQYNEATGAMEDTFIPARDMGQPRVIRTSPTPNEAGFNAAMQKVTEARAGNVAGLPEVTAESANRLSDATRVTKAKDTASTVDTTHRVSLPYEQRMSDYNANQPTLEPFNDPNTGDTTYGTVRKVTGQTRAIPSPAGLEAGKARDIPATIADNTAGLNSAEVEGVKVLRALRASGLDQSNDPLDPRFQKFLVNTLKVAPEDLVKGDIQQRVGFINANLTRALMGSRPSQYVAQTIIQPHLPKQEMTGMQLYRVLTNVLEQTNVRREEFAHTLGIPSVRLNPTQGGYASYQQELGVPTNEPPTYTLDANGNLVPVRKQ